MTQHEREMFEERPRPAWTAEKQNHEPDVALNRKRSIEVANDTSDVSCPKISSRSTTHFTLLGTTTSHSSSRGDPCSSNFHASRRMQIGQRATIEMQENPLTRKTGGFISIPIVIRN